MSETKATETTYVVQRFEEVDIVTEWSHPEAHSSPTPPAKPTKTEKRGYWVDIATVKVPLKSKRQTIIRAALAQAEIKPGRAVKLRLRVLDERAAKEERPAANVPEPEWTL